MSSGLEWSGDCPSINKAEVAEDLSSALPADQGIDFERLAALILAYGATVHRSKRSLRPYCNMAPLKMAGKSFG